jgi:hypothetical protein
MDWFGDWHALPLCKPAENSSRAFVEAMHPVSPVRFVGLDPEPYRQTNLTTNKKEIQNVTKSEAQWRGPENRTAVAETAALEQWENDVGGQYFRGKDNRCSLRGKANCCRGERFYLPEEKAAGGLRLIQVWFSLCGPK